MQYVEDLASMPRHAFPTRPADTSGTAGTSSELKKNQGGKPQGETCSFVFKNDQQQVSNNQIKAGGE